MIQAKETRIGPDGGGVVPTAAVVDGVDDAAAGNVHQSPLFFVSSTTALASTLASRLFF